MKNDPLMQELQSERTLEELRNRPFEIMWNKFTISLILIVIGGLWAIFHTHLTRAVDLPDRPFAKSDLPLLKKKVQELKTDAKTAPGIYPHLRNQTEIRIASKTWEELYYTSEIYPASARLRRIQNARILKLRPDLAGHIKAKWEYEEGRYNIVNDPAISDKAAAIAALEKQLGSAIKDPEYSKAASQAVAVLTDLIGDPELDRAEQAYNDVCKTAVMKRHPELAEYYNDVDSANAAYNHLMTEANALSRKIKALETGVEPLWPVVAKAEDAAENASPNPRNTAVIQAASAKPAPPPLPEAAVQYGVAVGNTVEISALKPMIAFRRATITGMDNNELTVRAGSGLYTVHWNDITRLQPSDPK